VQLTNTQIQSFLEILWEYYDQHGRHDLLWRQSGDMERFDPYIILVSEIMLQQTQVSRVEPKFHDFKKQYPTLERLAAAELADVLRAWQGLGYNRRAKFLWQAAISIAHGNNFPTTRSELQELPGIGSNTAGAILAYAYNQPAVFIETNIRTVYIHHFTSDDKTVSDDFIRDLLEQTLDRENPREFYWALMDYGTYLKTQVRNNAQSAHYKKQSKFEGSKRQVRGAVLRALDTPQTGLQLASTITDERLATVLYELEKERLICQKDGKYWLG
jgi:A/G-specific adenine glycosylase